MRELVFELLLRLIKPLFAALIGLVAWLVFTGLGWAHPSGEFGLLCLVFGGIVVLLVAEGPI